MRRTRTTIKIFLLVCSAHAVVVMGAEASKEDVAGLIRQLSARELQDRVAAEHQLRTLGTNVLGHLPDPQTLPPSAADAVRRIRTHLERKQAQSALKAGRVTIEGIRTLADVFAAIENQTGNRQDSSALSDVVAGRTISLALDNARFWNAIHHISETTGLVATLGEQGDRLVWATDAPDRQVPLATTVSGPVEIRLIDVSLRQDFIKPTRRILRLTLLVRIEPRLRPLFLHTADHEIVVAVRGRGSGSRILPPLSSAARREIPVGGGGATRLTFDVIVPENAQVPESVTLTGQLDIEIAAGRERFTFRHLDEVPITRRHGGVRVTLAKVSGRDRELQATLMITYDADGPRFESHRSWVFHNEVFLQDGETTPLLPRESEVQAEEETGIEVRYHFPDVESISESLELTYIAPTLVSTLPVKFELRDVAITD